MVKLPTRAAVCLLLAIAIGVTSVFSDGRVSAVAGDWLRGEIDFYTRNFEYGPEHGYTNELPPREEIRVQVPGGGTEPAIARVYEGNSVKIAEVLNRGATRGTYVADKNQDIYTRLNTIRGNDSVYGIRPIIGTDKFAMTVIMTDPFVGTWLSVVDDLKSHLSRGYSEVDGMGVYTLDIDALPLWLSGSDPDGRHYRLRLGNPIVYSKNMRYGVYPMSNGRYMRVDLMKKDVGVEFSTTQGFGLVSAVTNDGQYVFFDQGRHVVGVDDRCGMQMSKYSYLAGSFENKPACFHRTLDAAADLKFDTPNVFNFRLADNDRSIAFDTWSNAGEVVHVTADLSTVGGIERPYLKYLALGDSYSSGEGDIGKNEHGGNYYLPLTDTGGDNCHVSSRSYPFLLRDAWGIDDNDMKSVACSGARVVNDYYPPIEGYLGQGNRLESRVHEIRQVHQNALERFIPGRVPQLEFVKKYQPEIVTLTGGGNDVGFEGVMRYCALSKTSCGYVKGGVGSMYEDLMADMDDQYGYTVRLLQRIKEYSPTTTTYVIGYPKYLVDDRLFVCTINSAWLDSREISMINDSAERLNAALARAAADRGAIYIDIEDSLKGGRICEGSEYVTGPAEAFLVNRDPDDPSFFHPNARGHQKIYEAILKSKAVTEAGRPYSVPMVPRVERKRRVV